MMLSKIFFFLVEDLILEVENLKKGDPNVRGDSLINSQMIIVYKVIMFVDRLSWK